MQLFSNQINPYFIQNRSQKRGSVILMEILAHFEFGSNVAQKDLDVGQQTGWRLK